ncbi:MAG TPA: alpha/beta hydrolase [Polyangiales bacterium]
MSFTTTRLPMGDGTELAVYAWATTVQPKAVVQIAHGMSEHATRYDHVARALVDAGYAVYADDHRGHGLTAKSPDDLGFFADEGGWAKVVDDLYRVNRHIAQAHPGVPIVLLGHSMGSFLAQDYLCTHGDTLAAAVLSGTNSGGAGLARLALAIARLERWRIGPRGRSKLLDILTKGDFNRRFKPNRTTADWLSRDPAEVDKYMADPLCGFMFTVQGWIDLLGGVVRIDEPLNQARVPKQLPIYVFSGAEDPVGGAGKGVVTMVKAYQRAGLSRVSSKLYPGGRHEMVNETNKAEVIADLIAWLDAKVGAAR